LNNLKNFKEALMKNLFLRRFLSLKKLFLITRQNLRLNGLKNLYWELEKLEVK